MRDTTPKGSLRLLPLAGLVGLLVTQPGCFTLMTATVCAATSASDCADAIGAAAAVDVLVLDAAVEASYHPGIESDDDGWYDDCIGDAMPCEDDPSACCYE